MYIKTIMKYQKRTTKKTRQTGVCTNKCLGTFLTTGEVWKSTYNSRAMEERGEPITRLPKKNGEKEQKNEKYFPTSQKWWYNIINKRE